MGTRITLSWRQGAKPGAGRVRFWPGHNMSATAPGLNGQQPLHHTGLRTGFPRKAHPV